MNFRRLVLYAAAGLAGWWGVAWSEGTGKTDTLRTARSSAAPPSAGAAAAASLQAIQRPGGGSTELSRIAALIVSIPEDGLSAAQKHIDYWPPGAARQFARAVLDARKPAEPVKDTSATPRDDTEPSNLIRDLAERMATGELLGYASPHRDSYGDFTLSSWVSTDPAAATAAILKLPPESNRPHAVDIAAEIMAWHDPDAAMEFVFRSGEQLSSIGTSVAWAKSVIQNPAPENVLQYLDRMTLTQQNSLFTALAKQVPDLNWNAGYTEYDDANNNAKDPLHRSDLAVVACSALLAKESCPGIESLIRNLTNFPYVAEEVRKHLDSCTSLTPVQRTALETLDAEQLKVAAASGDGLNELLSEDSSKRTSAAVLDRAAPELLPQLARSGRLAEAVQLLDRIADPDFRRTSLEALLPSWMDANPHAARAAFDAASLTALERERWERHAAFLMNPGPGAGPDPR